MNTKNNIVTQIQHICPVCMKKHTDEGIIGIAKNINKDIPDTVIEGYILCKEHKQQKEEGYIFLIEIDPSKSNNPKNSKTIQLKDVYRTGIFCSIKKEIALKIFTEDMDLSKSIAFIDIETMNYLRQYVNKDIQ